jgi:cyclophilin family peptidyl-prolyl cis-trans isomerase
LDWEESDLEHAFGVLSMVRDRDDPNSGGGQFVVCLSRAGCEVLDGRQVAFGELVSGGEALVSLSSVPVGPRDLEAGTGPVDRPLEPPVIERAYTVEAGPAGARSRVEPRFVLESDEGR